MVMASALLSSRTEPCWGERKAAYTRTNPNPSHKILPNPNPSPSPNSTPPPRCHDDHGDLRQNHLETIEPAALPSTSTSAAASNNSYSSSFCKPKPPLYRKEEETGRYVTYNISNYSKEELRELKRKLVFELELVRRVASRIDSTASVVESTKKKRRPPSAEMKKVTAGMMKRCSQILTKLMKHAGAVWFRAPVNVVALKLYDYHQIIKNPMDLGTVRYRLSKGLYAMPVDFAADVRLTFNNALIYNPPGHDVHMFAGLLLRQFESSFASAYQRYEKQLAAMSRAEAEREIASSRSRWPTAPLPERQTWVEGREQSVAPPPPPMVGKKARGKDVNKKRRGAMTLAEKERLTSALEELPEEKTEELLQIIRKRNVEMVQQSGGDGEVELDFEVMDNETLWELARFVSNCKKKLMSKIKRRRGQGQGQGQGQGVSGPSNLVDESVPPGGGHVSLPLAAQSPMAAKGDDDDDDVDICDDDDIPVTNYPSMEIEKDTGDNNNNNHITSSSSSGSDSSSSSSDGCSSGSDDAQSPAPRN